MRFRGGRLRLWCRVGGGRLRRGFFAGVGVPAGVDAAGGWSRFGRCGGLSRCRGGCGVWGEMPPRAWAWRSVRERKPHLQPQPLGGEPFVPEGVVDGEDGADFGFVFGALFFGGGGGVEEVGLGAFGALGAFPLAGGAGGAEVGVVDGFEAAGGIRAGPRWWHR